MSKLNLGSGTDIRPDYLNIDIVPYNGTNILCDIRHLPLEDSSAEYIVAQHSLEYLPRRDVVPSLKEWRRVLKPGCHLEIRVLNLPALVKALFLNSISGEMGLPAEMVLALLYGGQKDKYNIIQSGFTSELLQGMLAGLGFQIASIVMEEHDIIVSAVKVASDV